MLQTFAENPAVDWAKERLAIINTAIPINGMDPIIKIILDRLLPKNAFHKSTNCNVISPTLTAIIEKNNI